MSNTRISLFTLLLGFLISLPAAAASRSGELRGVWIGGGYGRDWNAITKALSENGFNALFLEVSAGAAYYPSKTLPAAAGETKGRDEIAEAVKAAKQYGVEVHLVRSAWRLEAVPPETLKQYEADGRLMRDAQGHLVRESANGAAQPDWLCPSNLKNRKLEKDAVLEVVRKYDLAGIQLASMRFPSADYCYCEHCRAQFQADTGLKVEHWPADVVKGGTYATQYEQWRQGLLTTLVKEIGAEAHEAKLGLRVSLATSAGIEAMRHEGLQDWPTWAAREGLDFVCVLADTRDREQFRSGLVSAVEQVGGHLPVYAVLNASSMQEAATLIQQVEVSREAGADGFIAMAYDRGDLAKWLPQLHTNVTASDPNPMPHAGPPTILTMSGPALPTPPHAGQAWSGKKLTVQMTLGAAQDTGDSEEGVAEAGSLLQQVADTQKPVQSYEPDSSNPAVLPGVQLSGRMVAEAPDGEVLRMLGVFTGGGSVKSSFTFTVPRGPFRIAIYGEEQTPESATHAFVIRSGMFTGTAPASTAGEEQGTTHEKINALMAKLVKQIKPEDAAKLNMTTQLSITGDGGGDWWITAKDGKVESGEGAAKDPNLTVSCSSEDALALCHGDADAMTLVATGRLTISGDVLMIGKLIPLLKRMSSG